LFLEIVFIYLPLEERQGRVWSWC